MENNFPHSMTMRKYKYNLKNLNERKKKSIFKY